MKLLIFFGVIWGLCACAPQSNTSPSHYPFDGDFIADERPPHDEEDLRELLLTLPVWDIPPERIVSWMDENGSVTGDTLVVHGDGAQVMLRLRRLDRPDHYELRLGSEDWPEGGLYHYTLQRVSNKWPKGWKVLTRD
ncbi:hypothetical protein AAFN60_03455 [Roseibacillus persicicus]|uniref:hypothetical protein n=1 Tax=Roseibacillus persicicus TaxID=454148 RepID=UPI00398B5C8B